MGEIKYRFRLELIVEKWGSYKKGDVDTFIIPLLSEQNGLIRFGIDKQWKVISCDRFIGETDIKGNEIFENDITKDQYIIKWHKEKALFAEHFYSIFQKKWNLSSYPINARYIEIIGNIHENSELLKHFPKS